MEIVTGSTGQVHVTPIDDAVRNGNYGYLNQKVVFTCYENLEARAITANQVRVFSGYGMNQGRLFKIDKNDYDNVTIENGSQGYKRADLIVARYTMDSQTGFEDISLEVIKGQSGSSYVDPSYNTGNINNGADLDDFPLYRVKINGLQIEAVEQMFTLVPDGGRLGVIENKINTNMKVNLASENAGNLDNCYGVANMNLGVTGALPVAHGGTGANSLSAAAKNIVIDNLGADTGTMAETTEFITSESGGGFTTLLKKRTFANIWASIQTKIKALLGMGSTEIVSVSHGGTGKASVTSGSVLVGNGTGAMTEKAIIGTLDGSNDIPTAKAVSDAMSEAGYGDMMKTTYTNQSDCILVSKGGTGSTDGTLNGVKLATSGTTKGFINANGNFQAFRNPTGGVATANQATAAQVLSGKHFANSSGDDITGTFASQEKTITASRSQQTVTPDSGKWLSKVTVNKYPDANGTYPIAANAGGNVDMGWNNNYRYVNADARYNQGKSDQYQACYDAWYQPRYNEGYNNGVAAAQAVTWTEFFVLEGYTTDNYWCQARCDLSLSNVSNVRCNGHVAAYGTAYYMLDANDNVLSQGALPAGGDLPIPNGAAKVRIELQGEGSTDLRAVFVISRQAKLLH